MKSITHKADPGGSHSDVARRGLRGTRRAGRVAAAIGIALIAGTVGAPSTRAQTTSDPGFGEAQATLVMIDPRSAELSFGVRFGPTIADHRNGVARAVAHSTDYGLIGTAITAEGCDGGPGMVRPEDLPQRLRADSRDPEAGTERTVQEGPIVQSVLARPEPHAQATSRLSELVLPGIARIAGASNRTTSGVDDAGRPHATGAVDIAELSLAGGLVELRGLRWEADATGGADPVGRFTIGSATVAGTPLPTQDASAVVAAVNDVLDLLGLVLSPPRSHVEQGTLFVDPIRLGVRPNAARDRLAGEVLAALQPLREEAFGALLEVACDMGAAITVVDILLGSVTGGGSLTLNIGGTQAKLTEAEPFDGFGAVAARPAADATPPAVAVPRAPTAPAAPAPAAAPTGAARTVVAGTPATDVDMRSDGALAVGLAVLGLGAVLVEADRRKMRAAVPPPPEVPAG